MRHFHNTRRSQWENLSAENLIADAAMPDRKRRRFPVTDALKVSALERATRVSRRRRLLEEALCREQGQEMA